MPYKMELELTGLKVKIEHDNDTVPPAVAELQKQLTGIMQSVNALAGGGQNGKPELGSGSPAPVQKVLEATPSHRVKRGSAKRSGSRPKTEALELKHDAEKYGQPKQEWNTANKSMWLLYMLGKQTEHTEATAPVIGETFNKYFREFGTIIPNNVTRDLGAAKNRVL